MDPRHALGKVGEQSSGFYFGRLGYVAITGPSGSSKSGHGVTASGFDGVFYNPKTDHLIIADNKASSKDGKMVYSASAIDKNFNKNITKTLAEMQNIKKMPQNIRARVTQLLTQSRNTKSPPANVTRVVQNAHGLGLKGIAGKLSKSNIVFVPFEMTFKDSKDLMKYCANPKAYKSGAANATKSAATKSTSQTAKTSPSSQPTSKTTMSAASAKSAAKAIQNKTVGRTLSKTAASTSSASTFKTAATILTKIMRRGR